MAAENLGSAGAAGDAIRVDGALRERLGFDDARLLNECTVDFHRVGGPGGQHRNKVVSAVRLVHRPSGLTVTATERRSQHENKSVAIGRLRQAIAIAIRAPLADPFRWPEGVSPQGGRLRVGAENPALPAAIGLVLDAVVAEGGDVARAAARMDITSSNLVRFLGRHDAAWTELSRLRRHFGLPVLKRGS